MAGLCFMLILLVSNHFQPFLPGLSQLERLLFLANNTRNMVKRLKPCGRGGAPSKVNTRGSCQKRAKVAAPQDLPADGAKNEKVMCVM
jgi:hypothetical protein